MIQTCDSPNARHWTYHWATTPHVDVVAQRALLCVAIKLSVKPHASCCCCSICRMLMTVWSGRPTVFQQMTFALRMRLCWAGSIDIRWSSIPQARPRNSSWTTTRTKRSLKQGQLSELKKGQLTEFYAKLRLNQLNFYPIPCLLRPRSQHFFYSLKSTTIMFSYMYIWLVDVAYVELF